MYVQECCRFSINYHSPLQSFHPSPPFPFRLPTRTHSSGSKWSATNLIHLRDFIMEEVLTDEVTPSPDGYTVLLGRFTWQGRDEKAILKMRPEQLPARDNAVTREHSHTGKGILKNGFWVSCKRQSLHRALSHLSLRVQLESGAEYGYYSGSLSPLSMAYLGIPLTYHIEVIAPASPRQIVRAHVEKRVLIRESPALYRVALGPLADEVRGEGRSLQWVYNILEHKKEAERIVFEDPPDPLDSSKGFVLVPDPKWKSHPDPSRTPKEEWRHHPSTSGLACLAIVHDRSIGSLRDLRRRHLPLLQSLLAKGLAAIEAVYGVGKEEVRVFVHYVPQFFHFHGTKVSMADRAC